MTAQEKFRTFLRSLKVIHTVDSDRETFIHFGSATKTQERLITKKVRELGLEIVIFDKGAQFVG